MHPCLFGQFNFYPNYSTYSILIRIIPILSKIFNFYSKTFFSLSKLRFALISILYWKFQISLQFPIFLCENQIIPSKISRCFLKTVSPKKSCELRCSLLSVCHVQFFFSCNLCSTYVRLTFEMNHTLYVSLFCLCDQQRRIFWTENIDKFLLCIHTIFGSMHKNTWCIAQTARKWFSFSSAVGQGIMEESILHCHWARKPIKSRQVTIVIWLFTTY